MTPRYIRLFFVVCAIVGQWTLLCVPCPAETVRDYSRLLSTTSQALHLALDAEKKHPGSQTQALKNLASLIPASMQVTQTGSPTINVDLRPIRDDISIAANAKPKARLGRIESVLERVETLRAAAFGAPRSGVVPEDRGKKILRNVLARGEYQPSRSEEFMQNLMRYIANLLDQLNMPKDVADVLVWVVLAAAVIAFVIVLVILVLKLVAKYTYASRGERDIDDKHEPIKGQVSLGMVLADAEREAAAGHYREAFRRLYLASILTLDRKKLVKYADGVTNWEYMRALMHQNRPDVVEAFRPMTESFDQLIYGKRSVTERDYQECFQHFRSLEEVLS